METLSKNENVTFDYVILDDNSTDGTREMLKDMQQNGTYEIDLIEGDGSNFWNGGMYKAIEHIKKHHTDYDYYMLMNDDTNFYPGIFDEMLPTLKADEVKVGAICGEKGELSYGGIKYTKGIKYKKMGPEAVDVNFDTFNANCAVIPHDIFMQVGIDPYYQHSIGDFDYGLQIHRLGYEIRIYPKYVGECNDNTLQKTWQDETLPRLERIRLKESRKGLPFKDWFHFLHKNFGLGTAIVRSITPYIRIILGTKTRYSGA
jgi:GT2 family glycosyltransferase